MVHLIKYVKPYRWAAIVSVIFVFLQSLANLYLPTLMSDIVDTGIVKGDLSYILNMGLYMLAVTLIAGVFTVISNYLASKVATGFGRDVRSTMFAHVETFSLKEFDQIGTSSLITRTTNDIAQIEQVFMMILKMMVMAPLMCIGGIIMAIGKDAELALVLVVSVPVLIAVIALLGRTAIPIFKQIQKRLDRLNLVLREQLTGVRVLRAFNREDDEAERFDRANRDVTDISIRINKIMAAAMPLMMLIMNLATVAIVWFGGLRISSGAMQVGDLMAFIQYAMQIMFSVLMGAMMFIMIPRAEVSAQRVVEVLNTKSDIHEEEKKAEVQVQSNAGLQVSFAHATYHYPGAEDAAIDDVTFTAEPGQTTAIIGGTGSGKSTLLNLILRFFDVDSGSVAIGGIDVRDWTVSDLRDKLGYVPQKVQLFNGTVAENIRYGQPQASDKEVIEAARIAQANDFIEQMSGGYEAQIAQGGRNISGGQKQRLSIARALVRRAAVYLFDDSFSALDYRTDAALRAELAKVTQVATLLIVAQRVSTVLHADKIVVLDEGRIAGIGTHEQLMQHCSVYQEIVASQLDKEELA
ncbi:MAG: ABC transporter ATP-binding protein [Sporolactobacillus sp.]